MCGWPPYIDVQVCRVDIKCNRGYVDGHHILKQNLRYRDVIKKKEACSCNGCRQRGSGGELLFLCACTVQIHGGYGMM